MKKEIKTIYCINKKGDYLGAFVGCTPEVDYIEVKNPPEHGRDKHVKGKWVKHTPKES